MGQLAFRVLFSLIVAVALIGALIIALKKDVEPIIQQNGPALCQTIDFDPALCP